MLFLYTVSKKGIQPGAKGRKAVGEFPAPTNVHTLRQFLGMTGYFRKFIENHAKITAPLTELVRMDQEWNWTPRCEEAIKILKERLMNEPILKTIKPGNLTALHTDASHIGIAAILMQQQDGQMVVSEYYSRRINVHENNYHSYDLEALAVVEGIEHFKYY